MRHDEKMALMLEPFEYGVVFHALKEMRGEMLKEGRPTDTVDDILLKVIRLKERQPEKERKERTCHDAR